MSKAMENRIDNVIAFGSGSLLTMYKAILNINWALYWQDIAIKAIGVVILGIVGGFAGLMGKWLFKKMFGK